MSIKISADKAGRRAKRLDNFDFEEISNEDFEKVIKLDEVKQGFILGRRLW